MLAAFITITGMFTIILVTHNYMLEAMSKDASGESKPHQKLADSTSQLHYEKSSHPD